MSEHQHGHNRPKSPQQLRTEALEALLTEKGLIATDAVDAVVEVFQNEVGPQNGARMVARAWVDPGYRERMLANGSAAAAEFGYGGYEGEHLRVVENRPGLHNVIVCTLCSCYPWPVLGIPPVWYKSAPYRSRVVREPRAVLAEFGLELPDETQIQVWDSSAEMRYLVLPMRPEGSDDMSEQELAELVTRDCMIGVATPKVGVTA
ncbi:MAG TPA: nitrile hydratase subunit alpha [Gaiellales bacterium]|nr:nitrile hydratase subunit alpha [Gaiellales bacterium]